MLVKLNHRYDVNLININTGELVEWSIENYKKLTSTINQTPWRVIYNKSNPTLKETSYIGWNDENRYLWTYGEWFKDCESL